MYELRPGLWTWTAPHPERQETEDWGPDVRSYAYDAGACMVLFDPISPPSLLDNLVEAKEVGVVLTAAWHRRSADACVERFGAHVYAPPDEPPADVVARRTNYEEERVYWIPKHGALVVGDPIMAEGGLRVRYDWPPPHVTRAQMEEGLRPLLDLPIQLLLVTHGDPVVDDAHEKLRAALEA
jgi:hypothetical protein